MTCQCNIIPIDILKDLGFDDDAAFDEQMRKVRIAQGKAMAEGLAQMDANAAAAAAPAIPSILVFDAMTLSSLPGTPVANPGGSPDATVKRAHDEAKKVAKFYKDVFGRNSIDNFGMTVMSSVHYRLRYNNAIWNGSQMAYGDGDGTMFVDFTRSNDVIAHEITHGVTQFTSQFAYTGEAGGLNESMSDVFGSMYRQWSANQSFAQADWLIGSEIMGPGSIARGKTCLRDMANPAAARALAPQPKHFSQFLPTMGPHTASGIPNHAFYLACQALGGKSWEKIGKVWYKVLSGYAPKPSMKMKTFANRTRRQALLLFPFQPAVRAAIDHGWDSVGL